MAERVVKVAKTLRNNWKKTTFFVLLGSYGIYYVRDKMRANKVREEYCRQALVYGNEIIQTISKPRKVTIILNPAARKGKGKKLFEKNAAPLLHLAGIDVEVVKTEFEGHGKDCAIALETTDAVVVAGGDGTLGEVITGLLRRNDEQSVSKKWPIGVIPVGFTNTLAKFIYLDSESEVRWMCNAAMAIIKGITRPVDVLSIQDSEGRSVYGVSKVEWGEFRNVREKIPKYWYFGPLKSRFAYAFASVQEWPPLIKGQLSYRPPVDVPEEPEAMQPQYSFFGRLFSWIWGSQQKEPEVEEVVEEVPCKEVEILSFEFSAKTNNDSENNCSKATRSMQIEVLPNKISKTNFIKEGWRRVSNSEDTKSDIESEVFESGEFKLTPIEPQESSFSIDNEKFDAHPIHVKILPNKLRFFINEEKFKIR
ncbi:acylglycerol kinase, mitochondrial-like [Antedon mediterranea]|uniref:acylglycerol kinase, mitochondrial-like n=1 Tax=Antedon mediterranea TaxID=105859 RepID=UPI003AF93888